jgi:GT2 family glycosyltransferase
MTPIVGIVLVNYNGRDDTLECLESLGDLSYPNWFAVLVDNASTDGCAAAVRASFPEVRVIESAENLGFAGGNNVGIRAALERGAEFLFLLNNDTTVAPDLLERLTDAFAADPALWIAGPVMCYYDDPQIVWSAGGRIDDRGQSLQLGQGQRVDAPRDPVTPVDFVVGCGLMIRRAVLERVGLLDEAFFLYYEETDLCARVRAAGGTVATVASGRLWHKISRSTGTDSPATLYYMRRNQLLYLRRHGTWPGRAAAIVDSLRLLLVWTLQRNPKRTALRRALRDYFTGRLGKAVFSP